jgi:nicotinamide riboside transporter PnuC
MNRWLARLSMSFFIIATVLAWSAYQALQHNAPLWQATVDLFGAAAAIVMGVVGTRIKHSSMK